MHTTQLNLFHFPQDEQYEHFKLYSSLQTSFNMIKTKSSFLHQTRLTLQLFMIFEAHTYTKIDFF